MVTISILAILLGIGVPNLTQMLQSQAAASSAEAFVADLRLARSEAVKRGVPIELCGLAIATGGQGTTYNCQPATVTNWATNGWMIANPQDSAHPIKVQDTHLGISTITPTNATSFKFNPSGILAGGGWARVVITPSSNTSAVRTVCINAAGKARIVKGSPTCTDGSSS